MMSHAGAARFAFNAGLSHVKSQLDAREEARTAGVSDESLPTVDWTLYELRRWWNSAKDELAPWWASNSKETYSSGLDGLARALRAFTKSRRGNAGRPSGFPTFRIRARDRQHWAYTTGTFGVADPYGVNLPRIGRVHTHERIDRRVAGGHVTRLTISRSGGRWYAAFTVERDVQDHAIRAPSSVGVDLGIRTLATLSDGRVFENPKHLRVAQQRLRRANRALARTVQGSAGRARASRRLNRVHARVAALRSDSIHKMTTAIANDYTVISLEDLNVAGMLRNHRLALALSDASFAEVRRQLAYKTARRGGTLLLVDRFFPSSKTCSACGDVKTKLSLADRTFTCGACGASLDRDLNAAINIHNYVAGSGPETQNGGGAPQKTRSGGQQAMKPQPRAHQRLDVDRLLATVAS